MRVRYVNHKGKELDFMKLPYIFQSTSVLNYTWNYESNDSKYNQVKNLKRAVTNNHLTVAIMADTVDDFLNAAYRMFEIVEEDTVAQVPGKLYVDDYYLKCYIVQNIPENWNMGVPFMKRTMYVLPDYPYWCKEETKSFPKKSNESIATYAESVDYYAAASGTADVAYGVESFEIDTGLESIDSIVVFQEPTTSSETFGWVYSDRCKGCAYRSSIGRQFVFLSSIIEINEGKVTLKARNSDYPIKQTSFQWVAYGKKTGSNTNIKKNIEFEIPTDASKYTIETGLQNIRSAIVRKTNGYSSENGTHMFLMNSAVNGYSYYKKDTYLSYNYFSTSKELITIAGGTLTINEAAESYPIRDGSYSCIVYEETGNGDAGGGNGENIGGTTEESCTYPYGYPYGYSIRDDATSFVNDHYADCDFQMIIYGPCTEPAVRINGHLYEVIVTLYENEYMVIDSRNNSVTRYRNDGTTENMYNSRNKKFSVFKKMPSGVCNVSWNSEAFGFDIILFQERSEPKWSL